MAMTMTRARERAKKEGINLVESWLLCETDDVASSENISWKEAFLRVRKENPAIARLARTFKELDISHLTSDQKLEQLRNLATGTLGAEETE